MPSFLEFSGLLTPVEASSPLAIARYNSIVEVIPTILDNGEIADEFGVTRMTGTSSGLDVSVQKNMQWPAQSGVADADTSQINKALQAVEAGVAWRSELVYQGVSYPNLGTGSFPAQKFGDTSKQHRLHNKCLFLDRAARSVRLAMDGGYTTYTNLSGSTANISTLRSALQESALWLEGNAELDHFFDDDAPFNQRMSVIAFLQDMGDWLSDSSLEDLARAGLEQIISERTLTDDEGLVLQEKASRDGRGFDSGYQTLSLELLAYYYLNLDAGSWKNSVLSNIIQPALNKFVARVDLTTGAINTDQNTRTEAQGPRILPGVLTAKGIDVSIIPWRMQFMAYITGNTTYSDIGDLILTYGQGYGHISDDDDDDGDGSAGDFMPDNLSLYGQSIGGNFRRFVYPTTDSVTSPLSPNYFQSDPMRVRPGDMVDVVSTNSLDPSDRTIAEGLTLVITDDEGNAERLTPEPEVSTAVNASARTIHTGGLSVTAASGGTDTSASTTETYHCELSVPNDMVIHGIAFLNGSAVAGNIKGYLTDESGTVVASTISTAADGTDAFQRLAFTSPYLAQSGPYWVALQASNSGYKFRSHPLGNFGAGKDTSTVYGTLLEANVNTTFVAGRGPIATLF